MIIHDPNTRDRMWEEAGGTCALLGHEIPCAQAMLDRTAGAVRVVGWMGGVTFLDDVQKDLTLPEFGSLFLVRWVPKSKIPDLHWPEGPDGEWAYPLRAGWITLLAWAAWRHAGDQSLGAMERAYWWTLANRVLGLVMQHGTPSRNASVPQVRVVLPVGLARHPCLYGAKGYGMPWHQVCMLDHKTMGEEAFCSEKTVAGVRQAMATDMAPIMFDPDYGHRLSSTPPDATVAPFFLNPFDPKLFSVVGWLRDFQRDPDGDALRLMTDIYEGLTKVFMAHQVDEPEARKSASAIALAAFVVVANRDVPQEEVVDLGKLMHQSDLDTVLAQSWVAPLNEAMTDAMAE